MLPLGNRGKLPLHTPPGFALQIATMAESPEQLATIYGRPMRVLQAIAGARPGGAEIYFRRFQITPPISRKP